MPSNVQPRVASAGAVVGSRPEPASDDVAARLAAASDEDRAQIVASIEERVKRLAREVGQLRAQIESMLGRGPNH